MHRTPHARPGRPLRLIAGLLATVVVAGITVHVPAPSARAGYAGPIEEATLLLAPADGAVLTPGMALEWSRDPTAEEYRVGISTSPDFASGHEHARWTARTSLVPSTLAPGTYWWRVRASPANGHVGPTSATRRFTVKSAAPAAPSLTAPVDGASLAYPSSDLLLRWDPVPGAGTYEVQFASDAAFTTSVRAHPTSVPVVAAQLVDRPVVYWRVRAGRAWEDDVPALMDPGPWSAARMYSIPWSAAPAVLAPADGALVTSIMAEWQPMAGATGYWLSWTTATDPGFTQANTQWRTLPYSGINASPGETVLWRVRAAATPALDSLVTPWSAARTATVDPAGDPPGTPAPTHVAQPALLGPAPEATSAGISDFTLEWAPVDGAVGYQVAWVRDGIEFDAASVMSATSATVAVFGSYVDEGSTYHWRVRALNGEGEAGAWSETGTLHIAPADGAVLLEPGDGATVNASELQVEWTPASMSGLQRVVYSQTPDFVDASPIGYYLLEDVDRPPLPAGTWYWKVGSFGYPSLRESEARSFTVVDDVAPAGFATLSGSRSDERFNLYADLADPFGTLDSVDVSLDDATWTRYPTTYDDGISLYLPTTTDVPGWTSPGRRDLRVRWRDTAGNVSEPVPLTFWTGVEAPPLPDWPTRVTAAAGHRQVTLHWSHVAGPAEAPVTGYRVTVEPAGRGCTAPAGTTSCTVTDLANGEPSTFRVSAVNDVGIGPASPEITVVPTPSGRDGPVATVRAFPAFVTARTLSVRWSALPGLATVRSYDVRYRVAPWNRGFGSWARWRTATTATGGSFRAGRGTTTCFAVRARDAGGRVSAWSTERCTGVPLDDRRLARDTSWRLRTSGRDYAGTSLRATSHGARLTLSGVRARSIAVLVTTRADGGTVDAYWNGSYLRSVRLASGTPGRRVVLPLVTWAVLREGRLELKVRGSGRVVVIDGIGIRR